MGVPANVGLFFRAARPRTLAAAIAPVLIGTALAHRDGRLHVPAALAALAGAVWIQIGTNLANDYFDHHKGADRARIGPERLTASGRVSPSWMRRAFLFAFGLALVPGAYLIARGGWPLAIIGLLGILAGVFYTAGRRALAYLGLGELFVLLFFGPVAVAGTYFAQALEWSAAAAFAGLAPGLLSTALLCVNNLRDRETDREAGKRTLAVRLGRGFAKSEIVVSVVFAALVPIGLWYGWGVPAAVILASATCLTAAPALLEVAAAVPGSPLLRPLVAVSRVLVWYPLAFATGLLLTP
jgi:1,4-dihydroxy-2-naphthoate octaprenyltransferase